MSTGNVYRYPGTQSFDDSDIDRQLFFGREKEIQGLFHKVLLKNLVVLYGKSGLGKTSLINAGLKQLLWEKDYIPFNIRFNVKGLDPLEAVYDGIKKTIEKLENRQKHIEYEPGEKATLWQYFKTACFWSTDDELLTPVLILDQFEDFFTTYDPVARKTFIKQLADLLRGIVPIEVRETLEPRTPFPYSDKPPDVKILISIREDLLGLLDEFYEEIPAVLHNRFRLRALDRDQATAAIIKPSSIENKKIVSPCFTYTPGAVVTMLDFLCEKKERDGVKISDEVEPFQLQLLCRHIEDKISQRKNGARKNILKSDLGGKAGMQRIFKNYYEDRLKKLGSIWDRMRVRKLFKKGLISVSDRRLNLEDGDIEHRFKVKKEILSDLVKQRLLRCEPRRDSFYYELSHDTLIEPIRESQKQRTRKTRNACRMGLVIILCAAIIIAIFSPRKEKKELQQDQILSKNGMEQKLRKAAIPYYRGYAYYLERNYDKAVEKYDQAIKIKNDYVQAYNNMGNAFYFKGRNANGEASKQYYEKAIEKFTEAIAIDKNYFYAYNGLGLTNYELGDYDKAIKYYRKAIKIAPNFADAYYNLGLALKKQKKYKAALKEFEKYLDFVTDDPDAHYEIGLIHLESEKFKKAIKSFDKTIKLKPAADSYFFRAYALYYESRYDESIESCEKALDIDKANFIYKTGFVDLNLLTGRFGAASLLADDYLKTDMPDGCKLYIRLLAVVSLLCLGKEPSETPVLVKLDELIGDYKPLNEGFTIGWGFKLITGFIKDKTKNGLLSETKSAFLLKLIGILKVPKENEKLKELEKMRADLSRKS